MRGPHGTLRSFVLLDRVKHHRPERVVHVERHRLRLLVVVRLEELERTFRLTGDRLEQTRPGQVHPFLQLDEVLPGRSDAFGEPVMGQAGGAPCLPDLAADLDPVLLQQLHRSHYYATSRDVSNVRHLRGLSRYVTLRRMERGWSAEGLLRPLWRTYPGGRDGLARAVGTSGTVLSSVNSGKRSLGVNLGRRIADELNVPLSELGAPATATPEERSLFDRLEGLEEAVALILEGQQLVLERQEEARGLYVELREICDERLPVRANRRAPRQ